MDSFTLGAFLRCVVFAVLLQVSYCCSAWISRKNVRATIAHHCATVRLRRRMNSSKCDYNFKFDSDAISTRTGLLRQVDVMAERMLDFENVPQVQSTKQFLGTLRSGSSRLIPEYVHGIAGLPSMADKGDEVFVTRGLLIRMTEPPVGDGDSGRRGGDRSHVALRVYTQVSSPNTATVAFTCTSVWVCVRAALHL